MEKSDPLSGDLQCWSRSADPENDLVNYFLSIDTWPIATVLAKVFGPRGERATEFHWFSPHPQGETGVRLGPHPDSTAQGSGHLPEAVWVFRWQSAGPQHLLCLETGSWREGVC